MKKTCFVMLAILLSMLSSTVFAANVAEGERLAKQWCVACHVVSKDQTRAMTEAPPFSSIAGKPNFNAARLALFLLNPHPVMPNMSLTRDEAADLAAYIGTQKE
jgi:mono/diheme cytochrome c family protein